jgi:hypothetical protein
MSADKQYDRQFLAWAVDRAIRICEVNNQPCDVPTVTDLAQRLCAWIQPAPDAVEPTPELTEEEKLALAEHEKHVNGVVQ